jgi:hypothetical protein
LQRRRARNGIHRIAVWLVWRTTLVDQVAYVDASVLADHDVIATRAKGIACLHNDALRIARIANNIETTYDPVPMQESVVKLVLLHNVMVESIQVFIRQELTCEETRSTKAVDLSASGTWWWTLLR